MSYKITDTIIVDQSKNINSIGIATFAGPLIIGGGTSTGTVSQTLQINNSGAYISGSIGVGITNPVYKLNVQDTVAITNNASNVSNLIFPINGSSSYNTWITADGRTSGYLALYTNSSERLRVDSSGNLGIGITNPTSKLQVSGDIYNTGIHTAYVLNASKDPGTGIATDFTNSLFGNGWRLSAPASTTYYKLATLPPGGSGSTFDHLTINGVLGAWTNGNQTPFEITFSNRGAFNYKYISYGSVRSDVKIVGISTNNNVEIWAQHQSSQFTKLVYNITNSIEAIVVSNPTSTTTAPTGTTVFDSSTATPRFIINESDYVGIGTISPPDKLTVFGKIQIQQDASSTNRLVFRGQPASLYRWNIDNYGSTNDFRIFREDDGTAINGATLVSISTIGTLSATKFSGDGSLLTNLPSASSQWVTTSVGIHTLSNVGIGTTNPTSKLTVSGNASITGILTADQVYTSNNGGGQNVRIGDDLWIGDVNISNTTRFSGAQDGTKAFIIFGTSDAVALGRTGTGPLYYGGDFTISGISTANSFRARGGAPGALGVNNNGYGFFSPGDNDSGMYSSADGQIEFYTNSTEAVRIDSNQRVGIGTTNPSQTLDVNGNVRFRSGIYDNNNSVGSASSVLTANGSGGFSWQPVTSTGAIGGITITDDTSTNASRYLLFTSATSGSITAENVSSTKLVYNPSTGRFGIGTTNPQAPIHINYGNTPAGSAETLRLEVTGNAVGGRGPSIDFYIPAGSGLSAKGASIKGVSGYIGFEDGSGNNLLRLRTDNAQTVGVGTIGVDWLSSYKVLQVGSASALVNTTTTSSLYSNYYDWNGGGSLALNNGFYGNLSFNYSTGDLIFSSAGASTTAGLTASLTERFRTNSSGNLLIGSASDTGTASQKLQVTGGAYVSGNLGVGATAPAFKADIAGDARVTSTNKMRFGGTAGTTNFYIQYNSTTNSLDFVAG